MQVKLHVLNTYGAKYRLQWLIFGIVGLVGALLQLEERKKKDTSYSVPTSYSPFCISYFVLRTVLPSSRPYTFSFLFMGPLWFLKKSLRSRPV